MSVRGGARHTHTHKSQPRLRTESRGPRGRAGVHSGECVAQADTWTESQTPVPTTRWTHIQKVLALRLSPGEPAEMKMWQRNLPAKERTHYWDFSHSIYHEANHQMPRSPFKNQAICTNSSLGLGAKFCSEGGREFLQGSYPPSREHLGLICAGSFRPSAHPTQPRTPLTQQPQEEESAIWATKMFCCLVRYPFYQTCGPHPHRPFRMAEVHGSSGEASGEKWRERNADELQSKWQGTHSKLSIWTCAKNIFFFPRPINGL